jgi:hypothetical protein
MRPTQPDMFSISEKRNHNDLNYPTKPNNMKNLKTIMIAALLMLAAVGEAVAQNDFSTVNVFVSVPKKNGGFTTFELFFNNRFITNIQAGEILKYKMYSQGRLSILVKQDDYKFEGLVTIDKSSDYYVVADLKMGSFKIQNLGKEEWEKLIAKNDSKPVLMEEDIRNPFGIIEK